MIKSKIILLISLTIYTSCLPPDEDREQIGFTFDISNNSNVEYHSAKITIGGMKDGEFTGTESYLFPKLFIRTHNLESQIVATYEDRWRPNLELISTFSERAYFKFELEGRNSILLYSKKKNEIVSRIIPENGIIKNDFGKLQIVIEKDNVFGAFPY